MRIIMPILALVLLLPLLATGAPNEISTQHQQTAEYWIKIGNELNDVYYVNADRSIEAVKAFDKAIEIDPSNRDAWTGLKDALRKIVVSTNYNVEYERQSENVYSLLEHLRNLSDPRCAPALSDHANRTAHYLVNNNEIAYATEYDVIEALNGTPYFEPSEREAYGNHVTQTKVALNMTSNTSDSERAARLVFEALFKYPRQDKVNVICYEAVWDRICESSSYIHDYTMTREDAEKVEDWTSIDLRRYDSFYQEPLIPMSELVRLS